jgi:hypothetical protein
MPWDGWSTARPGGSCPQTRAAKGRLGCCVRTRPRAAPWSSSGPDLGFGVTDPEAMAIGWSRPHRRLAAARKASSPGDSCAATTARSRDVSSWSSPRRNCIARSAGASQTGDGASTIRTVDKRRGTTLSADLNAFFGRDTRLAHTVHSPSPDLTTILCLWCGRKKT